jgi:hypothetical protein
LGATGTRRVSFALLAWLAALLPLVASHAAYLISASLEAVPWCVPHLEGCTSVSRAARSTAPAIVLYKSLLLPYSVVLVVFWWQAGRWLREVAPARRRTQRVLLPIGLVAGIATATYTAALGTDGEVQQWIRRYAINVGFGLSVLAELLLAAALAREPRVPQALRRALVGLCAAMLALGLASIPLQFLVDARDAAVNAIEWTVGVLMLVFYPLAGAAWRRTVVTAPAPA